MIYYIISYKSENSYTKKYLITRDLDLERWVVSYSRLIEIDIYIPQLQLNYYYRSIDRKEMSMNQDISRNCIKEFIIMIKKN